MAWIVEDRRAAAPEKDKTYLTEGLRAEIAKYFPRYPTKRACLLPALHLVQHQYNWIPPKALQEIGEYLGLAPAEVIDTATFYEEYWLKPKGKYLIGVCRSLACEICGHKAITKRIADKLKIDVGETTADGRFTLIEMECLGSCGTAPAALVNEVLHETLTPDQFERVIDALPPDPHDYVDPTLPKGTNNGHH